MSQNKGYAPYIPFYPKDELSKNLLASIPKKVAQWLINLEESVEVPGESGALFWNFSPDGGTLLLKHEDARDLVQIWWTGPFDSPSNVCGSESIFEDITHNLATFVGIEQDIYAEMQKLQVIVMTASAATRHLEMKAQAYHELRQAENEQRSDSEG